MPLFSKKRQLKIQTLVSKILLEKGEYLLNFDVAKTSENDTIKEIRGKEKQVYEELDCIIAPCSRDIMMELKDDKCQFTFTVSGALEPSSALEKGEDVLEYNDSMPMNSRHLYLTPTFDKASDGKAFIKFWVGGNVKHTVTIRDVPVENTKKMSSSTLSRRSSDGSSLGLSETFVKSVDEEDRSTVDAGSVCTFRNATIATSSPAMSLADNRASPVLTRSTEGPTCVPDTGSADLDDENKGADGGDQPDYDLILTDASLQCLVNGLSPQDCQKLLIQLLVPCSIIEQQKKDHPGDIVMAMVHCFLYWRGEKRKSGQLNQDTNEVMCNDLIAKLEAISRRDIKLVVLKALEKKRGLEKDDFKRL